MFTLLTCDSRNVHQSQSQPPEDTVESHEHVDIHREGGHEDGDGGDDGSGDAGEPGAELVDEDGGDGSDQHDDPRQDAAHHGDGPLARVVVVHQGHQKDAEAVANAV